jgi:pimeloyl-ACP methyl ester carboxylesterase
MRAAYPDTEGFVVRDGVRLGYEVYGHGEPAILFLPTWTIVHSRSWKMQVPFFSRFHRVVTYDGPGNGLSARVTDPDRYSPSAYVEDAVAVLDACNVGSAVVIGLSLGAAYGSMLAERHPKRVVGLVMIGPSIPLTPPSRERSAIEQNFTAPLDGNARGWAKYNLAYWHHDYADFTRFFFSQCFNEPHSTKPIEDSVGWAEGAGAEVLEAEARSSEPAMGEWRELLASITCPVLVIHGDRDMISPQSRGVEAARLTAGELLTMKGSGHIPNVRDPVKVNLAIRAFVEEAVS